ncbi:MAG: metallophosphoesterase [Bacteroidetes bacterium]|nr:metallophosphoesterase [Bacteroidota bacterium]HET6244672.1 metallophosphoesterase [Bacteroidia bacterium]
MNKKVALYLFCFLFSIDTIAINQPVESPFNNKVLKKDSLNSSFSFIVTGHLHGASSNISGFPAASLLANIDTINSLNADFIISLGDLFLDVNDNYVANYKRSLFDKLNMPLFNAVGNHDLSGNRYESYFGKTFFSFVYNENLFIFLDTEINDGSIKGEQMEFFKNAISQAQKNNAIKNIFIASHRPVWSENNSRYNTFFKGNTQTQFGLNNFKTEVSSYLNELSTKSIFWFSGSMASGPVSFFYDKQKDSNISFIITAIRDLKRDAILLVSVNTDKAVEFNTISLTGEPLHNLQTYDIEFWNRNSKNMEMDFNYRLIPYLTLQMIKHYHFWIGLAFGILIMSLFVFIKRRFFFKNKF